MTRRADKFVATRGDYEKLRVLLGDHPQIREDIKEIVREVFAEKAEEERQERLEVYGGKSER